MLAVVEYRKRDPLMPVKALSTQLPVTGTAVAMIAGAVFVTAVRLALVFLTDVSRSGPAHAGCMAPRPRVDNEAPAP